MSIESNSYQLIKYYFSNRIIYYFVLLTHYIHTM